MCQIYKRKTKFKHWIIPAFVSLLSIAGSSSALAEDNPFIEQVRYINTTDLGIPSPIGLTYSAQSQTLLLGQADQSLDTHYQLIAISLNEDLAVSQTINTDITNPANISFDATSNRLLLLNVDNSRDVLISIKTSNNGELESLERFDATSFGLENPQGITVDTTSGVIYILDTAGPSIVRVEPDSNGSLNNAQAEQINLSSTGLNNLQGIAFNPNDGYLYVLDTVKLNLVALSLDGKTQSTRNLSKFKITNPKNMVFAPSGDRTDDASEMSLYINNDGINPGIVELTLFPPKLATKTTNTIQATKVSATMEFKVKTSRFNPPSSDPSGIGFLPETNSLLISDGEIGEAPVGSAPVIFEGYNLFETDLDGNLIDTSSTSTQGFLDSQDLSNIKTANFSDEPTGVSEFNPNNNTIFFSDDDSDKIFEVDPGRDGQYGTSDDDITFISTRDFSPRSEDPEGVAYAAPLGDLFVVDGINSEIYRVSPGGDGRFYRTSDNNVTHFDTEQHGLQDPEGITYFPATGNLLAIGNNPPDTLFELTTSGELVRKIDFSEAKDNGLRNSAGLALAPPDASDPNTTCIYLVDRADDNNSVAGENDGLLFKMCFPTGTIKSTNSIERWISKSSDDAEEHDDGRINLTSSDLELVQDGGNQTVGLRFINISIPPNAVITNAFVQFQADETNPQNTTNLTIEGQATSNAATFKSTSGSISSRPRTAASRQWSPAPWTSVHEEGADQRTPNIAAIIQEIVGSNWSSGNSLVLIITGTGERTAESFDGNKAGAPLLHIEYSTELASNQAPTVNAGTNQGIALSDEAILNASVTDDGLPASTSLTTSWSKRSGPGTVRFGNTSSIDTTASFSEAGTYELKLTANDGEFSSSDKVTITVSGISADGTASIEVRVSASSDDAEENSSGKVFLTSSDLELVYDKGNQSIGMRFNDLALPPRAIITKAYLQFQADETTPNNATNLTIEGEAVSNAAKFASVTGNISIRPRTDAFKLWSPDSWRISNEAGLKQRSPDISPIIQEIVNLNWSTGNSMVLIITGTGERTAESYDGNRSAAPLLHIEYATGPGNIPGGTPTTIDVRVSKGSDDAEETSGGKIYLSSSDIELVYDKSNQTVGLRFNGLGIPAGSIITNASVQFQVDETTPQNATDLIIEGEAVANPGTFTSINSNISSRLRTLTSMSWSPAAWTVSNEAGADQKTPDISTIIQEIVDSGAATVDSLVLIITGTGERTAESFEGKSAAAALLHVEFIAPAP